MKRFTLLAGKRMKLVFFVAVLLLSVAFGWGQRVQGASVDSTWTVCDVNCDFTLIQAAVNDVQVQNGDTLQIKFNTIHTESNILVDKSLTFAGLGDDITIIQAANDVMSATHRIFTILDGVDVTIQDLTLQHGNAAASSSSNKDGGAIWKGNGSLTISSVKIIDNHAVSGGGIASVGGTLNIIHAHIAWNDAVWNGGGIYSEDTALSLSGGDLEHEIWNNSVNSNSGGGIYHAGGAFSLQDYRVRLNTAEDSGGGIYVKSDELATIHNSLIASNTLEDSDSGCGGGGIHSQADLIITESDILQNSTDGQSTNDCDGGGIEIPFSTYDLTISDSVIQSNWADAGQGFGGGIDFRGGILVINNSSLNYNGGTYGSALLAAGEDHFLSNVMVEGNKEHAAIGLGSDANLTLSEVEIFDTESESSGGGLSIQARHTVPTTVRISHSRIQGNSAPSGAGIYAESFDNMPGSLPTNLIIDHSQIVSNTAVVGNGSYFRGDGGGIWVTGTTMTLTHSLVSGNQAENDGGGLYVHGDYNPNPSNVISTTIYLYNSTISGNSTVNNGGGIGVGDALQFGEMHLMNMTVSHNVADTQAISGTNGGGIYQVTNLVETTLVNSILAGNRDLSPNMFASWGPDCVGDYFVSAGYNIVGTRGSGGPILPPNPPPPQPCTILAGVDDQIGVSATDLALDDLRDNGGSSATHALLAGSVAINAGDPTGCKQVNGVVLETDQRDYARPDRCDIGAYEYNGLEPPPPISDSYLYLPFIER